MKSMKKLVGTKRLTDRRPSDESYSLPKLFSEEIMVESDPNPSPPISLNISKKISEEVNLPWSASTPISERHSSYTAKPQHRNDDLATTQQRPYTCDITSTPQLVHRSESISKRFQMLISKVRPKDASQYGEECDSYPHVFPEETSTKYDSLPQISPSECLRYAIAKAVSHQMIAKEKIHFKPHQIITALMNSLRTIDQTNPKKYNKLRILLQDHRNHRSNSSVGTFWEVT